MHMKVLRVITTTAVFLLLGATIPAFAQEEHHEEAAKPAQQEEKAKPAVKQEQPKPQKQEEQAKPAKQEQAKPQKQEQQANGQQQQQEKPQQQAKSSKQEQQAKVQQQQETKQQQQQVKTQQNEEKNQQHQQQAKGQAQQSQGQFARNGQKDSYGHVYNESHFGPNHHARFEANGGRYYNGRREYSYGGYWFYAGSYPAWFYQQDVYFIMGADGLWYAVASGNPSLMFQVNIG
jgi:outer membrane biosynthesis protein TonB